MNKKKDLFFRNRMMAEGFSQMPRVVLRSPKISMQAKQVYLQLMDYAWYGECYPGRERLALENGTHINTVDKYIKELKDFGLITVERMGKKLNNNIYIEELDDAMIAKLEPYLGEVAEPEPEQEPAEDPPKKKPAKKPKKSEPEPGPEEKPAEKTVYERVVTYLNGKVGRQFQWDNKPFKKLVDELLNNKFTTKDIKMVIDYQAKEWLNDSKMQKYLRPSSLFRLSNFVEYVVLAREALEQQGDQRRTVITPDLKKKGTDFLKQYYGDE